MRVIGGGNILLCGEGIGVHVVRELSRRGGVPGAEFVDGGVAGATLLNLIEGEERIVLGDAADAPFPPGTVVRLPPGWGRSSKRCGRRSRRSPHPPSRDGPFRRGRGDRDHRPRRGAGGGIPAVRPPAGEAMRARGVGGGTPRGG